MLRGRSQKEEISDEPTNSIRDPESFAFFFFSPLGVPSIQQLTF